MKKIKMSGGGGESCGPEAISGGGTALQEEIRAEVGVLEQWLRETDAERLQSLFRGADLLKRRFRGDAVYFRGLIELSNICRKNCLYCGIRRENEKVVRYELNDEQVLAEARFAAEAGYGSVVLQGGERTDPLFVERIVRLTEEIRKIGIAPTGMAVSGKEAEVPEGGEEDGGGQGGGIRPLGITLSFGEQKRETYRRWFRAGAHRYLLRIESSDRELYRGLHPEDGLHLYESRLEALRNLKEEGYIVGTGVMIGLPGQNFRHLAEDLLFFRESGADMIGMGPYIPHPDTPMGRNAGCSGVAGEVPGNMSGEVREQLLLSLKMVALARYLMPSANIAATTALQVLAPDGREQALLAGANVIMPNITETSVRKNYQLYSGKSGLHDTAEDTGNDLVKRLEAMGLRVGWQEWGDPPLRPRGVN